MIEIKIPFYVRILRTMSDLNLIPSKERVESFQEEVLGHRTREDNKKTLIEHAQQLINEKRKDQS